MSERALVGGRFEESFGSFWMTPGSPASKAGVLVDREHARGIRPFPFRAAERAGVVSFASITHSAPEDVLLPEEVVELPLIPKDDTQAEKDRDVDEITTYLAEQAMEGVGAK